MFKVFGSRSVETVERNPYLLCSEGVGITFEKACSIASRLPVPPADECRIDAGILYVVKHNLYNGHTCLPREKLIPPCCDLLDANADTVDIRIDYLIETRQLVSDNLSSKDFIFLPDISSISSIK